jgi:hypothetical protein
MARLMHRFASLALVCAWLCAQGAIWDAVQVVAWAKMVRDYSAAMPLAEAVKRTFDGSAPCELCGLVEQAKQQDADHPTVRSTEKLVLALPAAPLAVFRGEAQRWDHVPRMAGRVRTDPVPVPPPRA